MRPLHLFFLITVALSACSLNSTETDSADQTKTPEQVTKIGHPAYDPALAKRLQADDYGMSQYIFATLLTGPNDAAITDADERAALFSGHFANMERLAKDGKLVLAGPFMEASPKRGLFILDAKTIEEAESLVQTDPAIAAGIFKVRFDKYYGSAALREVNRLHSKIQKNPIE